jgi:hypothetical protein
MNDILLSWLPTKFTLQFITIKCGKTIIIIIIIIMSKKRHKSNQRACAGVSAHFDYAELSDLPDGGQFCPALPHSQSKTSIHNC